MSDPDDIDRRSIGQVAYEAFMESDGGKGGLLPPRRAFGELPEASQDAWNDAGEEAAAHWSERCSKRLAMASYCARKKHHDGKCEP